MSDENGSPAEHRKLERVVEQSAFALPGFFMFFMMILLIALLVMSLVGRPVLVPFLGLGLFLISSGFCIVAPNEAKPVVFFGQYKGTLRQAGFFWTWPLSSRSRVSLRLINFDTKSLKVNDAKGNPIEIGAVVVWRVENTARAVFNVDNYQNYVETQAETALRALASHYPYDAPEPEHSLRGSADEVAERLKVDLQKRLNVAGITVEDTRLSHLSYAPEIAAAMLRRQQAEAVITARRFIVENAIGMVDDVMRHFEQSGHITLNDDRKANMITSLLVTLVAVKDAEPVIRVGG